MFVLNGYLDEKSFPCIVYCFLPHVQTVFVVLKIVFKSCTVPVIKILFTYNCIVCLYPQQGFK